MKPATEFSSLEYLKTLKELEAQYYTLNETINELDKKVGILAIPQEISVDYKSPNVPIYRINIVPAIFFGITGFIIWAIAGFDSIGFCVALPFLIIAGYNVFSLIRKQSNYEKECAECSNNVYGKIRAMREEDKIRVESEKKLKNNYLSAIKEMQLTQAKVCGTLDKLYGYGIIYEKYHHDLSAICMFYEYFASGRCESFQGHEGAYNIYESEVRSDTIISKLDVAIEKMDDIMNNQYALYNAVNQIVGQQERIIDSINNVADSQNALLEQAEHIRYNTEITAYNSEVIKYYQLFS